MASPPTCFSPLASALALLSLGLAALPATGVAVEPPVTGSGRGLTGLYFDNPTFSGEPRLVRVDPVIDETWGGASSPDPSIPSDFFSVRWVGQIQAERSEPYTFITDSDEGIRVRIGGVTVIDNLAPHPLTRDVSEPIALVAGQRYDITVEFIELLGHAEARLRWRSPSTFERPVPASSLYPREDDDREPRSILREVWTGIPGARVDDLTADPRFPLVPSFRTLEPRFEAPTDAGERLGTRMRGLLAPEATGSYDFWISADDAADLYLSPDHDPANRIRIASVPSAVGRREWMRFPTQHAGGIELVAGRRYAIEALHKESRFADHLAVAWAPTGGGDPQVIDGRYLRPGVAGIGTGLAATYFADLDLTSPVLSRLDPRIDFDFGLGSPDPRIEPRHFSARWEGFIESPTTEVYTLITQSDDGIRVRVSGELVIDNWNDHGLTENTGTLFMVAGRRVDIVVEYYEHHGAATARLLWESPSVPRQVVPTDRLYPRAIVGQGSGLQAAYFDDADLAVPLVSRIDAQIAFDWGAGSPDPAIEPDAFSARWAGRVQAQYSETYEFSTLSDDSVRLWVDGELLIDDWNVHGPTVNRGAIALEAGQTYDIVLEYFEWFGLAELDLMWASPSTPKVVVPTSQLYPLPIAIGWLGRPAMGPEAVAWMSGLDRLGRNPRTR